MTPEEIEAMKAELAAAKAERDDLKKKSAEKPAPTGEKPDGKTELSLEEKAKAEREAADKKAGETKVMESALRFDVGSPDWLKNNATLLPQNIAGIFEAAKKEVYGSVVEKVAAIKVGVFSEFFAQQENLDQLTDSQKQVVEEFSKLTKNVKQERVQQHWESVFEPTLESIRKVKKAQVLRQGLDTPSDAEDAYAKRMKTASDKYHLGR